jgi:hypothetical protein
MQFYLAWLIDQQAIISTIDDTGFDAALVDSPQRAKISFLVKVENSGAGCYKVVLPNPYT